MGSSVIRLRSLGSKVSHVGVGGRGFERVLKCMFAQAGHDGSSPRSVQ